MHVVVMGPMKKRLAAPVNAVISKGVRTCNLCAGSSTPLTDEDVVPIAVRSAGKVRAMRTGSAVCMAKYIGNNADWRVAKEARGSARKETIPAIKDWKIEDPNSVP